MPALLFIFTLIFMMSVGGLITTIMDKESFWLSLVFVLFGAFSLACAMVLAATVGYEAALT